MNIIGLSGTNGSGKDTVAEVLAKHGFFVASATEMLEEELKKRGLAPERENKRLVGDEWRRENIAAIVDKAIEQAKATGHDKLVVGSLRNPGEADRVHALGGKVVWVDADPQVRYERIKSANRGRVEDNKTYEQFLAEEQDEMSHYGDESTLNMSGVKAIADVFLTNDSDKIEDLKIMVEKELTEFFAE